MSAINIEVGSDGVAVFAIDVPGRSMNVLSPAFTDELAAGIERVVADPAIRGAVLISSKSSGFIAGADLKDFVTAHGRLSAAEGAAISQQMNRVLRRMETCGKPFAAAINGLALGGGFEVCLACHYRVLSDSSKAVVGLPEVKIGLLPGGGGTQRLPRLIGITKALSMLLDGNSLAPAQALNLGLVHAVKPADQLLDDARNWVLQNPGAMQPWDVKGYTVPGGVGCNATSAAENFQLGTARLVRSTRRNHPAPIAISASVFEGTIVPFDAGLRIESKYFGKLLAGPVARNLMRTLFVNKGTADKLERRPQNVAKFQVRKLGVLGAGMMGSGIAHCAAAAGVEVVLLDSTLALAVKGKAHSADLLEKTKTRGQIDEAMAATQLARITPTDEYAALAGCDVVLEAVFENQAVKQTVYEKAAAVLSPGTLFASNTSTLPITGLARHWRQPERFIGLHFFSPVDRMPLVEVIRGEATTDETLAQAMDFIGQLRKTPIVVNDGPGFFTSRVFGTFIEEGAKMLDEGVAPALIDNAARLAGMPTGPLAISDEVSISLLQAVHETAVANGFPERFCRLLSLPVVQKMMALKRTGRRDGAGFFDYSGPQKKFWEGLAEHFPLLAQQPAVSEVQDRLLYIQALESARCLEENILTHPADGDLGSILGIGFPSWTGGTLSFIDTIGIAPFVARCEQLADAYGERYRASAWLRERARRGQAIYAGAAA